MSKEQKRLENCVAAVLSDTGQLVGTAFLYRKENGHCLWLTCHHVIARLNEIYVGNEFRGNENGLQRWNNFIQAEYMESLSYIEKDIVTIRTPIVAFLDDYRPIPLGDPSLKPNDTIKTIGFKPSHGNGYPRGEIIVGLLGEDNTAHFNPTADIESDVKLASQQFGNPWNYWHSREITLDVHTVFFTTTEIEGGLSGAPVCKYDKKGEFICCIGILNSKTEQKHGGKGTAITFSDIYKGLGTAIPFFPYSDLVVVTIAAHKSEMQLYFSTDDNAQFTNYHLSSREMWQCFQNRNGEMVTVEHLLKQHLQVRGVSFQTASDYIGNSMELIEYIIARQRPILFIIDGASLRLESLKELIHEANLRYTKSSAYLLLRCGRLYTTPDQQDKIKDDLEQILNRGWIYGIKKEYYSEDDFFRSINSLVESILFTNEIPAPSNSYSRKPTLFSSEESY